MSDGGVVRQFLLQEVSHAGCRGDILARKSAARRPRWSQVGLSWFAKQQCPLSNASFAVPKKRARSPRQDINSPFSTTTSTGFPSMNFHEYQAKELFEQFGIPVPRGQLATTAEEAVDAARQIGGSERSEEHTSELQSRGHLVCRLLLEER